MLAVFGRARVKIQSNRNAPFPRSQSLREGGRGPALGPSPTHGPPLPKPPSLTSTWAASGPAAGGAVGVRLEAPGAQVCRGLSVLG